MTPSLCWRMEDVLAVYTRAYDPRRPQVCLDETSRQLLAEVTPPLPVTPGRPARQDYEYQRRGVCNVFLVCEPLAGWRDVMVSARRTRIDWAHCIKDLVDVHYPDAERIVLVQDNPEHPHARVAVPGVPARGGQAAGRQAGAALHAQAWQLVEHGRDRACRAGRAVPGPARGRPGDPGAGGRRVGGESQRDRPWGRLALHDRGRPDQAQAPLPGPAVITAYRSVIVSSAVATGVAMRPSSRPQMSRLGPVAVVVGMASCIWKVTRWPGAMAPTGWQLTWWM